MYGAVANSVNTWFAQLAARIGPASAVEVARRMGISNIPPRNSRAYAYWNVCSLVLGAREVSVLDMAAAFGVLANKGVRCRPYSITKVVAPGERKPLIENRPDCDRVIDEKISTRTVAMLRGVVNGGTGRRASLGGRPVAGKTGSAQMNRSAFFSGFTPQLSTSVWVGFRRGQVPMMTQFNGGPVYGGTFPALIFHNYMEAALAGQPIVPFPAAPPPPPPPAMGVPDVVGLPQGQAQAILARAGFQVSARTIPSAKPKGTVVRQGPRAGTKVRQGTTVYLAISGGRTGGDVVVPGVVGLQVSVARALLAARGLTSGLAYSNSGRPGRVNAQSPGAGARLPKGSSVTLVVRRN
jgi:membrane peptidoglycan carboxypeptidase